MSELHFQEPESLGAQRISEEEARRVVTLWADKQREHEHLAGQPTVDAMVEGLGIPPEEVLRLLGEVRAQEAAEQARLAQQAALQQYRRRRTRARWGAALTAFVVAVMLVMWMSVVTIQPGPPQVAMMAATPVTPTLDFRLLPNGVRSSYERHADGSVVIDGPKGHYETHADGSISVKGPEGSYVRNADGSVELRGPGGSYERHADGSEMRRGTPPSHITIPVPPADVAVPELP